MLFPRVGRKQPVIRIAWWLVVAFLCLGITLHLFPFYFMAITSFKTGQEVLQFPPTWFPHEPTIAGWKLVVSLVQGGNSAASQLMDDAVLEVLPELRAHHVLGAGAGNPHHLARGVRQQQAAARPDRPVVVPVLHRHADDAGRA